MVHDMNSSEACLQWNNQSVWDANTCTIEYDRVNLSSLSANKEACAVDGVVIPLYPAKASAAGVNMSVVPWQCPPPIYMQPRPSCQTVGLGVGANMAMANPCFSGCFTVVVMSLTTEANCTAWSNNSHWDDDRCRIACSDLEMFSESLQNGTCVVDGVALTMYPGAVSGAEELYAVPMPCVSETICKFSKIVEVSSDALCTYDRYRFWIMIGWVAIVVVCFCFSGLCGQKQAPMWFVFICLLFCVVWELGVLMILLGALMFAMIKSCRQPKGYQPVGKIDPAALDLKVP